MTFSWMFWRVAVFVAPAYAFAVIVLAFSLAHGNARRTPWRVIARLLSAPPVMIGLRVLTDGLGALNALIVMALFAIAVAGFAAAMAWRYRNVDPAVAFCGLASAWGAFVVFFSLTIH